jgi:hypothetical protein
MFDLLTAADFVGGVLFQGSKKGKKVQKEQVECSLVEPDSHIENVLMRENFNNAI